MVDIDPLPNSLQIHDSQKKRSLTPQLKQSHKNRACKGLMTQKKAMKCISHVNLSRLHLQAHTYTQAHNSTHTHRYISNIHNTTTETHSLATPEATWYRKTLHVGESSPQPCPKEHRSVLPVNHSGANFKMTHKHNA